MIDKWIPVSEDTPPIEKPYKYLSRTVKIQTKDKKEDTAFFNYNKKEWRNSKNLKKIKNVIKWKDL